MMLLGFPQHSHISKKEAFCEALESTARDCQLTWVVMGDLNEVVQEGK